MIDSLVTHNLKRLAGVEACGREIDFRAVDLLDEPAVSAVLAEAGPDAVIHIAGLKAVGESVKKPLAHYQNNIVGTLNPLHAMDRAGVRTLVFSSSATLYGVSEEVALTEKFLWTPPVPTAEPGSWKVASSIPYHRPYFERLSRRGTLQSPAATPCAPSITAGSDSPGRST